MQKTGRSVGFIELSHIFCFKGTLDPKFKL